MSKKIGFLFVMLLISFQTAFAQIETITGTVTDEKGNPMPGVSVVIEGTTKGVATDFDGNYSIEAQKGNVLVFSYVGFTTLKKTVGGGKNLKINAVLKEDAQQLGEVVVVGYGVQNKKDLTGSVASLSEGNFTEGSNTNALQMLNGRASGVNISQTNSSPGSSTKIQVRGAGSINSSNDALVVVDGLPGVDPSSISPDDIKSIEILKDASASSIYGTRAANGVVLITTKTGKKGDLSVKYNASLGFQYVAKKIDVLDAKGYMETLNALRKDLGLADIYTSADIAKVGSGTNWQDEIFKEGAPIQTQEISVSGGGDKTTYYAGVSYFNQKGLIKNNSDFEKYNIRTNLNFYPKDFIKLKINLNFTRSIKNYLFESAFGVNEGAGAINSAIQFDPTLPIGIDPTTKAYYKNNYIALDNPLALMNGITKEFLTNNFYTTITTDIEPMKDLVATVRLGAAIRNDLNSHYRDRNTMIGFSKGGVGSKDSGEQTQWLAEFLLNYKKVFNEIHNVSILAGTTFEEFKGVGLSASSSGFLSDITFSDLLQSGSKDENKVSSYRSRNRLNGYLGRLNYGLLSRYLLTLSFRYDGTSRFSDLNKFALFPSAAFAWRISNEPFYKIGLINDLKLRIGYGQLGNQGIQNYQTLQTLIAGGSVVFGDKIYQGVVPARLNNPNLKWETTEEFNIGVDFSIWENRISGAIDYYIRDTKDQLFRKPLPSVIGFSNMMINAGTVRNTGVDLSLNTKNIQGNDFSWESSINVSFLNNKVIELPPAIPQLITGSVAGGYVKGFSITRVGDPMLSYYGYKVAGVFQTPEEVANSAQPNAKPGYLKFVDISGNGKIGPEDRVILGKPFPGFTGGFNNTFKYKNLALDIFVQWVQDVETLDVNVLESIYPTNEYRNRIAKYYNNRWKGPGSTNLYPSGVNPSAYGGAYSINSLTVQDASFFRFKTLNLSYQIPIKENKIIKSVQSYFAADNLFTITGYEGFDPDASALGNNISKVSYNSYPLARTYRIGLSITF